MRTNNISLRPNPLAPTGPDRKIKRDICNQLLAMHFTKPDAGKTISLEHEGFVGKLERVVDTDSLCIIIDIDPKKLS